MIQGTKAWIFQSRPDRFDLRTELITGKNEQWLASRYRDLMEPGDIVFYWLSGEDEHKGIYGWGRISSSPANSRDGTSVVVHNEEKLPQHIPVEKIRATPALKELMILRIAIGTNFILHKSEAIALAALSGSAHLMSLVSQVVEPDA